MIPAPQSTAKQANARRRAGGLLPPPLRGAQANLGMSSAAAASVASLGYASSIAPTEASRSPVVRPLPPHWDAPRHLIPRLIFNVLCLAAVGSTHLYEVWWDTHSQEAMNDGQSKIRERITTVTVVAGLILSATAALVTTTPPRDDIVNYNARGPYIIILFSLAISLGGLIGGSMTVYVLSGTIERDWFRSVLMSKRSKVIIWLVMIGYPFFSIAISIMMTALGLLIAAFDSTDRLVQICGAFALAIPISMACGLPYIAHQPGAREKQIRRWQHRIERRSTMKDAYGAEGTENHPSPDDDGAEEKVGNPTIMEVPPEDEKRVHSGAHGRVSFEVRERDAGMEV